MTKVLKIVKVRVNVMVSVMLFVGLTGCKLEGEDIGDLYGRWKLQSFSTGSGILCQSDTLYLSFQASVYQYQPNWQYDWGTYRHANDSLTLNPLAYQSSFGFRNLMHDDSYNGCFPVSFRVQKLSDKEMILQRSDSVWKFRKYLE